MRAAVVCRFPIYREALARLVGAAFGAEPAESFPALQEALDQTAGQPFDLVVADLDAGDAEFGELRTTAEAIKPAPLVMFSEMTPAEAQIAYEAGVKGCIPKTVQPELMTAALRLILAGGLYFSEFSSISARQPTDPPVRSRLSARQQEVLRQIEQGQTNKEIAKALGISVATVKLHVQAILDITGARNRTEAALRTRGQLR